MLKHLCTSVIALCCATSALATDLARWTFEISVPTGSGQMNGPWAAEAGVNAGSPANGFHTLATTAWSNPVGNGSAESWSSTAWSTGDYYQFATSTLGYDAITFSFDQTRSNTGPTTFDVELSVDGGANWGTLVNDYSVLFNDASNGGAWNGTTRIMNYAFGPIAAPPAAANQPVVMFRIVSQVTPAVGGTNRVDHVVIAGNPIVIGACCRNGVCAVVTQSSCLANGGTFVGEGVLCDPDPCIQIPTGACCRDGVCQVLQQPACVQLGGQFQGDGVPCDPNPCPLPTGACCKLTGECAILTQPECVNNGGQYQGHNTSCDPNPCPQPNGACCVVGCCVNNVTQAQCGTVGGTWTPLATCDQIPGCPLPEPEPRFILTELFVNPPGADQGLEAVEILGLPNSSLAGFWLVTLDGDTNPAGSVDQLIYLGNFSTGANGLLLIRDDAAGPALDPTPAPATNIVIHNFTPDIENGAITIALAKGIPSFAVGTDLDPTNSGSIAGLPGLCPVDAVSYTDGVDGGQDYADDLGGTALGQVGPYTPDALYRLFDCDGNPIFRWAGGDVIPADPNTGLGPWSWDPAESFGFLPEVDPTLLTLDLGRLNHVYCPPQTGACCRLGECAIVTQVVCENNGGQYQGNDTTCDPNPCPQPTGACCRLGECAIVTQVVCENNGGQYQGNDTTCDPNPCPQPTGACCRLGECAIVTQVVCENNGGQYQGNDTTCDPNPCPQPTGACCRAGVCVVLAEDLCVGIGGSYLGDNTVCDPNPCPPPACLGDADCDGDVDFFDIDPFVAKLGCPGSGPIGCALGCPWQNSDVDQDGDVDFFDIDPFVARLGQLCN